MQTPWIPSSTFLPYTGDPIDFLLEDREQPIRGVFADGGFHSRWADYDTCRVTSWRASGGDPPEATAVPKAAPTDALIAMLKRLIGPASAHRSAVPKRLARGRAGKAPASVVAAHAVSD